MRTGRKAKRMRWVGMGPKRPEIVQRVPRRKQKKGEIRALGRTSPNKSCSRELYHALGNRLGCLYVCLTLCPRWHKTWKGI